jgi:hypothetical protein
MYIWCDGGGTDGRFDPHFHPFRPLLCPLGYLSALVLSTIDHESRPISLRSADLNSWFALSPDQLSQSLFDLRGKLHACEFSSWFQQIFTDTCESQVIVKLAVEEP